MGTLKVVFLDWSGTLSTSKFWGHLECPDHPLTHLFPDLASTLFGEAAPLGRIIDPWLRGQFTSEQVNELVAKQLGLDEGLVFREFVRGCQSMEFVSTEVPDLVRQIREKGVKVVIASDNMDCFTRWTVPAMRLSDLFDEILNSYDLRAMKKDIDEEGRSAFFKDFMERHKLAPGESLIVDDSKHNRAIVESFGVGYHLIEPGTGLVPKLQQIGRLIL